MRKGSKANKTHFDKILHLHTTPLIPNQLQVSVNKPQQMPMFGLHITNNYHIGLFFEILATGLFGGKLVDAVSLSNSKTYSSIRPDVESKDWILESKCLKNGQHLNLHDDQVKKYKTYQILKPKKRIVWIVWRHTLRNSMSHRGSIDDLLNAITNRMLIGIMLPFSIILNLWENEHELFRRYETLWQRTSVTSPAINDFAFDPLRNMERFGLDPDEYKVERYITPMDFVIEKIPVKQFPLVIVSDKNPGEWIKRHNNEVPF